MQDLPDKNSDSAMTVSADAKVRKMPGVQLSVSPGKDVIIRVPGLAQSYRGRIVGFDPYDYLIASVRLPSSLRGELALGGQIIVKYINDGTVYGFKTYVRNAITSPTSLLFFDYPSVMEKMELRRDSRTQCNLDGTLHSDDGDYDCLILNISHTGCKVSVRAKARDSLASVEIGTTLILSLNLGAEGTLKLPLVIRNVEREQGIHTLGSMFLDLNDDEEERIGKYLERMKRLTR